METVTVVIQTVPREPRTLTRTARTLQAGLAGRKGVEVLLSVNAAPHPEAEEVAERFGWEVVDGTAPHWQLENLPPSGHQYWISKLTLDLARGLEVAADRGSQLVLNLEDDLDISSRFGETLYSRTWLTSLFSDQYGINNRHFHYQWGNQALLFRNDAKFRAFLHYLRERVGSQPSDWLLGDFLLDNRCTVSQRIPNPVEHVGIQSSLAGQKTPGQSFTYNPKSRAFPPLQVYWAARWLVTTTRLTLAHRLRRTRR